VRHCGAEDAPSSSQHDRRRYRCIATSCASLLLDHLVGAHEQGRTPIGNKLVASLVRPDGNVTDLSICGAAQFLENILLKKFSLSDIPALTTSSSAVITFSQSSWRMPVLPEIPASNSA